VGEWLNDVRNGKGRLILPDGQVLEAEWDLGDRLN